MRKISELSKEEEQRALDIHRRAIFINCQDSSGPIEWTEAYVAKLKRGGVTVENICSTAPSIYIGFAETVRRICDRYDFLTRLGDKLTHVVTVKEIEAAKKNGKLAIILGTQNAETIEDDVRLLGPLQKLGVRIIQLTYQRRNFIGDGCGEKGDAGLSDFGVQVVEQMNKLGLVIDLSHVGRRTTLDVMKVTKDPVIFSHSNSRKVSDTVRNITDEQIKSLAAVGGVMGISQCPPHVRMPPPRTTVEEYLNHVDYVVDLVGVDHVGIGLDNDEGFWGGIGVEDSRKHFEESKILHPEIWGTTTWDCGTTQGLEVDNLANITRGLVARGYSDQEIEKVLGGNFLRVFKRVWGS